jgi:glycosyltransferase involved in cell wall biosynthesis
LSSRDAATTIRILHLRDTRRICGPGKTICETVRLNRDLDVNYEVAAFGPFGGNTFLERASGYCTTFALPDTRARLPQTALALARRLREEQIGILHAHDFKSDLLGVLAGRLARVPVVTTVHGYIALTGKSKLYRRVDLLLLRAMNRVIVVSEAMRSDLGSRGIAESRLRVVRNGIALENYPFGRRSRAVRSSERIDDAALVVGHVGRLSAEKGQARLLRVFPRVLEAVPSARLVFAGDGPEMQPLRDLARTLGVAGSSSFLGYRDDVPEVFANLDLLVLSSDTEGLPNVVLEAMAMGVPVVATAVGGTPEVVEHGVTGLLVPRDDEAALGAAIIESLTARDAAAERARRARAFVEREFTMEVLIRKTHDLYRELLAETA